MSSDPADIEDLAAAISAAVSDLVNTGNYRVDGVLFNMSDAGVAQVAEAFGYAIQEIFESTVTAGQVAWIPLPVWS